MHKLSIAQILTHSSILPTLTETCMYVRTYVRTYMPIGIQLDQTGNSVQEYNRKTGNSIQEYNRKTGNSIQEHNNKTGNSIQEHNNKTGNSIQEHNNKTGNGFHNSKEMGVGAEQEICTTGQPESQGNTEEQRTDMYTSQNTPHP